MGVDAMIYSKVDLGSAHVTSAEQLHELMLEAELLIRELFPDDENGIYAAGRLTLHATGEPLIGWVDVGTAGLRFFGPGFTRQDTCWPNLRRLLTIMHTTFGNVYYHSDAQSSAFGGFRDFTGGWQEFKPMNWATLRLHDDEHNKVCVEGAKITTTHDDDTAWASSCTHGGYLNGRCTKCLAASGYILR